MSFSHLTPIVQDHKFLADAFGRLPAMWSRPVSTTYKKQFKQHGRRAANLAVVGVLEAVQGFRFGVATDDDDLRTFAKARADECFRVAARNVDKDLALAAMIAVAQRYEIAAPSGRNVTKTGQRMRLLDENWWRRNVRKTAGRNVEAAAIKVGLVSRVAGLYASDEAVKRRTGQRARNAQILSNIVCVNDAGQEYTLKDLSDLGTSNPEKRRMELMTRIAGFDDLAIKHKHAAEFYTLTAPSKYHARHHIHGRENPNYNQATPAETQAYLCQVWARIRAKLHRDGVSFYGFRVAEPHHDGTPHWHMLVFCQAEHVATIRAVIKKYALAEDGNEAGADIHRFKAEAIDRSKGSAVGYIAKYISKNIDGQNNEGKSIGEDWEAIQGEDDATKTARRVDAWAATWGIRQFQQVGGQSVTVWRELRRADPAAVVSDNLREIVQAADAGNWKAYTELNGGVLNEFYEYQRYSKKTGRVLKNGRKSIKTRNVRLDKLDALDTETGEMRLNVYTEPAAPLVVGFCGFGEAVNTHLMVWTFKRSGEAVTPRSSVNNCTQEQEKQNNRAKKRMKIAFLREVKTRPQGKPFGYVAQKLEFLTGEDLTAWKNSKLATSRPDHASPGKPKISVWPGSLRVLEGLKMMYRK